MNEKDPSGQLTDSKLIESLQDDFGWEIQGPFYSDLPDYNPKYPEKIQRDYELLKRHLLETVIIRDSFDKDHFARREFEEQHPEIATFNSHKCKLGANNLYKSICAMQNITERLQRKFAEISEILSREINFADLFTRIAGYNDLSFDEKVRFALEVDQAIFRLITILSE